MLILSNDEIERILPVSACLDALQQAYRDLGNGTAATVPRYDVLSRTRAGTFYEYKTMSGVLPSRGIAALRLNSSVVTWFEKNGRLRKSKLPAAGDHQFVGLVMLFDTETGEPLAMFPDGYVQKLRVGATCAIAARHLARGDSHVMALLGSGWQASAHLAALSLVRDLRTVKIYSPTREHRQRFIRDMQPAVSAELRDATSVEEALEGADLVTCTTNSIAPLFDGAALREGVHVSCVKPCELDVTTYRRADPLIIHSREARPYHIAAGVDPATIPDITDGWPHPITREQAAMWDFPTICQLVTGEHPGRTTDQAVTCFCNNVGLGLQFAAVGGEVLARARHAGVGRELPTEWFLESVHP